MKKTLALLAALTMPFFMTSCDEEDDDNPIVVDETSITDLAVATPELSTLVSALQRLELDDDFDMVGSDEFTVLAPTNDAFQALLDSNPDWNSLDDIDDATLTMVLNYHVLAGEIESTDLAMGESWATTSAMGPNDTGVSLYVNRTSSTVMFDDATVTSANIQADNGVVHVIDRVLMPKNLAERAASLPASFSSLVSAVSTDGLLFDFMTALTATGNPLTVFAPNNDAFQALLDSNEDWNSLGDIDVDLLNSVLQYHVVAGNNQSSDILSPSTLNTILDSQDLTFEIVGGMPMLMTSSGQSVEIVATDIQTTNGVIHVVKSVLLPGE